MFDCYLTLLDLFFFKKQRKNYLILLFSISNVTLNTHRQSVLVTEYSITVNTQHRSPESHGSVFLSPVNEFSGNSAAALGTIVMVSLVTPPWFEIVSSSWNNVKNVE